MRFWIGVQSRGSPGSCGVENQFSLKSSSLLDSIRLPAKSHVFRVSLEVSCGRRVYRFDKFLKFWCQDREIGNGLTEPEGVWIFCGIVHMNWVRVTRAVQKILCPTPMRTLLGWTMPVTLLSTYNCRFLETSYQSLDGIVTSLMGSRADMLHNIGVFFSCCFQTPWEIVKIQARRLVACPI